MVLENTNCMCRLCVLALNWHMLVLAMTKNVCLETKVLNSHVARYVCNS